MRRQDDGEPTRIVSPLKKVIVPSTTPKPASLKPPKSSRR
jgi:hypothetical protein